MSKTKIEIINETVEYIKENGRSLDGLTCVYQTDDGRGCAVGRCMDKRRYFSEMEKNGVIILCSYILEDSLDEYLKKEYRGHSIKFWSDLQALHDEKEHWDNENNLTESGINYLESLKYNYE